MNIFIKYLYWQLILTPKKSLNIWKNYLVFGLQFFSIKETLRSLFSPWRRYMWDYGRGFDPGKWLEVFFSNMITRVIGFVMRLFLIAFFLAYEAVTIVLGLIFVILSIIYPFLALYLLIYAFKYL
ncbi:MAG: hypothetical protein PHH21_03335 [Candidatus Pacebacteria bacterium]|nr:hypothetical protein [Candidatus Paceibacterota bacterium]